jgi:hypothetical protein
VGATITDDAMRTLVRHQWVREHGTPRVTTLVGSQDKARALWKEWLELSRRPRPPRLFEQPATADRRWLEATARKAAKLVEAAPREPVALWVTTEILEPWLAAGDDRVRSLLAEGVVRLPRAARKRAPRALHARARSLAELTLFEALEATPSTAGRFALNESLSLQFGSRGAEIDLLSRTDEIAIEVDGYHHFADADAYRRDRRKDLLLQAHGYVVLRILADDVLADPRAAVGMVVELLGRRLARNRQRRTP